MKLNCHKVFKTLLACWILSLTIPFGVLASTPDKISAPETEGRRVIAKVNGDPIYEDQLTDDVKSQIAKYKKFSSAEITDEYRKTLQMEALKDVIRSEVLYQESLKLKVPNLVEKVVRQVESYTSHPMSQNNKLSEHKLREMAERQVYVGHYLAKKNLLNPEIPESEIKTYYEKNKHHFAAKEESVRVRHILVQIDENASEEEKNSARKKIEEARELVVKGTDFAEVAKQYSEDNAASSGGDIGFIKRGYMPPEFEAVAFSQAPGSLSEIVKTKFGYHVFEVIEAVHRGQIAPYEDLKDFFGKFLREQNAKKVVDDHLQALVKSAKIEVLLD